MIDRLMKAIIVFLFLLYIFFSFSLPINDPDVPWHLKTGQFIYETHTIPRAVDPFSFADDTINWYGKFILSQYWIAQLMLYTIFQAWGVFGLVILKAVLFTALAALLWAGARHGGVYVSLLIVWAAMFGTVIQFSSVRPQVFTFLFAAVLLLLLTRWKDTGQRRYLWGIPLLTLVWANMHGGVIFGIVVLGLFLLAEMVSMIWNRSKGKDVNEHGRQLYFLGAICITAFITFLINPNGYNVFRVVFALHGTNLHGFLGEYKSPFEVMQSLSIALKFGGKYWSLVFLAVMLGIYFIVKRQWTLFLILMFATFMGFNAVRYLPLFGITLCIVSGALPGEKLEQNLSRRNRLIIDVCLIMILSFSVIKTFPSFDDPRLHEFSSNPEYAVEAASFLKENDLQGNIFVSYNKSGYILFSQCPESKVFYDSRYMSKERATKGMMISGGFMPMEQYISLINQLLGFKEDIVSEFGEKIDNLSLESTTFQRLNLLDEIGAEIIVHEAINEYTGKIYPLVLQLSVSENWVPIYMDGKVLIFVKNIDKFNDVVQGHALEKEFIYDEIILEARKWLGSTKPHIYTSIGIALLLKGVAEDNTGKIIQNALVLEPDNMLAQYLIYVNNYLQANR